MIYRTYNVIVNLQSCTRSKNKNDFRSERGLVDGP